MYLLFVQKINLKTKSLIILLQMRHDGASIGKIHTSVHEMVAQARQMVKHPQKIRTAMESSNTHLQIHLPSLHMNDRLKEIFQLPRSQYKKINRQKRTSPIKLDQTDIIEDLLNKNTSRSLEQNSLSLLTKLTDRYQLKSIINNFESQLVDKKFHQNIRKHRRPLCNKKTISLIPDVSQLPLLKSKSKSISKEEENSIQNVEENKGSKIYLSVTQEELMKAREKAKGNQYKTIEEDYPRMVKQLIEVSNSRSKRINRQKDERDDSQVQQARKSANKKSVSKNTSKQIKQEQKYEPWELDLEDSELIF